MADSAATNQEDDLTLPRAAVNKMIKEMIPNIRISNDARELVLNCCTEFIHLIASESNEICNKQTKKTISPDHVIAALDSLGFHDYVKDVEGVFKQFKTQTQKRKLSSKMKNQGVSEEELLRQQQELFAKAREQQAQEDWLQMQQQQQQQRLPGDPNAIPPAGQPPNNMPQQFSGLEPPMTGTPQVAGYETMAPPQIAGTNSHPPTINTGSDGGITTTSNTMDYDETANSTNNSARDT